MTQEGAYEKLFKAINKQLEKHKIIVKKDASIIDSPLKTKRQTTICFAHPYCSWEKGSIENSNKLIRQYVKKESNLNNYSKK